MKRHHTSPLATVFAPAPKASARFTVSAAVAGTSEAMAGAELLAGAAGFEALAARNGAERPLHERHVGEGIAFEASHEPSFACGYFLRAAAARQRTLRAGVRLRRSGRCSTFC